jgi:hypothetical protein
MTLKRQKRKHAITWVGTALAKDLRQEGAQSRNRDGPAGWRLE